MRPRYQVRVYRTIGPLGFLFKFGLESKGRHCPVSQVFSGCKTHLEPNSSQSRFIKGFFYVRELQKSQINSHLLKQFLGEINYYHSAYTLLFISSI